MSAPRLSTLIHTLHLFLEDFPQATGDHFAQLGGELEVSRNLYFPLSPQSVLSQ